jgi:hypothetical protein
MFHEKALNALKEGYPEGDILKEVSVIGTI